MVTAAALAYLALRPQSSYLLAADIVGDAIVAQIGWFFQLECYGCHHEAAAPVGSLVVFLFFTLVFVASGLLLVRRFTFFMVET